MKRGTAAGRLLVAMAAGLVLSLLSACAVLPLSPVSRPCPEGWRAAVVFSSETAPASEIVFVGEGGELERRDLPYLGISPSPSGAVASLDGAHVWMAANGRMGRESTHLVRFSVATCAVDAMAVKEPGIRIVAGVADGVLSSNTLNFISEIRKRDFTGKLLAEHRIPGIDVTSLAQTPTQVLALGGDLDTHEMFVLELDPKTLELRRRAVLPDTGFAGRGTVLRGGSLYFAAAGTPEGNEGRSLGRIDTGTLATTLIALPTVAPFLLAEASDALYIGYTHINPGHREMAEYRYVSRYDLATGGIATFDVGAGLLALSVKGNDLIVMTGDKDVTVSRFDRNTSERLSAVTVKAPTREYYYAAGLIIAPPQPAKG